VMLEQGAEERVFEGRKHEIVTNVLNLDERHVGTVLTPRSDIVFLDVREPIDATHRKLREGPHNVLPLCEAVSTGCWGLFVRPRCSSSCSTGRASIFVH
jgi:putative hemolysin